MFLSLEADSRVSRRFYSAGVYRRAERRVTQGAEVRCDMRVTREIATAPGRTGHTGRGPVS